MRSRRASAVLTRTTAAACLTAAAIGAVGASGAGAATTSWAQTGTAAVPTGSGVTALGALPSATPVTVQLALALRDPAAVKQDIAGGQTMSAAQFEQQFSPTAAEVSQVQAWLSGQGLTPGAVSGKPPARLRDRLGRRGPAGIRHDT